MWRIRGLAREVIRTSRASVSLTPLVGAYAASLVNSLLIAILSTRIAGVEYYGIYQLTFSILAVVGIVSLVSSGAAVTRAAAQGRSVAWRLFCARLPYCLATSLLLVCGALVLFEAGNTTLGAALLGISFTIPLFLGADVYPAFLLGKKRWRSYLRFQLIVQGGTVIGVAGALLLAPEEPWIAVLAVAAFTGIAQFAGLWPLRREATSAKEDIRYAKEVTLLSVLPAVDGRLDIVVVGALLSAKDAGLVAIARSLPLLTKRVWEILFQPFFVKMSAVGPQENLRIVRRYRALLFLTLGSASLIGALVAPVLLPVIFGKDGRGAVTLAQLLLLSTALTVLGLLDEVLLRAQGDIQRLRVVYVALPAISILTLPLLVYFFGIKGVGLEAVLVAATYVVLLRRLSAQSVASGGSSGALVS
jgi:O-antigen/teichoic acid export membrane protein